MTDTVTPIPPSDGPRRLLTTAFTDPSERILTQAESEALFKRVAALTTGGGHTEVTVRSSWTGNIRWARNRPTTSGDTIDRAITITRYLNGVALAADQNRFDDATLKKTVQQLEERLASAQPNPNGPVPDPLGPQQYLSTPIWSEPTFMMTPADISDAARKSVDPVVNAKLVAAGYVEVGATTWAIFNTRGLNAYEKATGVKYTETVRIPDGSGSGYAGKTHMDWRKLDATALSTEALQKCRDSANPVKIEPGRYTAILEPNAAALLIYGIIVALDRGPAETDPNHVYYDSPGVSKIGSPIMDPRITITSDPMDPECGYIPFDQYGTPYRKVTWVEKGILKELSYGRKYARDNLKTDVALPNPQAFRMSGGTTTIKEMIANTERGIYVNKFDAIAGGSDQAMSYTGATRDGLWLIEHGKISHPIKNMWIMNSPLVLLNQVLELGPPVRVLGVKTPTWGGADQSLPTQALNGGDVPIVMPPLKVQDFNFTRLTDSI